MDLSKDLNVDTFPGMFQKYLVNIQIVYNSVCILGNKIQNSNKVVMNYHSYYNMYGEDSDNVLIRELNRPDNPTM